MSTKEILFEGRHLRLVRRDGWEWCERVRSSGVVGVVALTPAGRLLVVEQHRPPVGARVLELPAGLSGDLSGALDEDLVVAARRELHEETGWEADHWRWLTDAPSSAGMTDERVHLFLATGLRRTGPGGGDASEDIVVHEVDIAALPMWITERRRRGVLCDPKLWTGLAWLLTDPEVTPPGASAPGSPGSP